MPYTEEWFRSNADATPRQCSCGRIFTIRDDYPWSYFRLKRLVRSDSGVTVCPECETGMVLLGMRALLLSNVRQIVHDPERALFRLYGRDIDKELQALISPVPPSALSATHEYFAVGG